MPATQVIRFVVTDPGMILALRWALAFVFVTAVVHKLVSPLAFAGVLRGYRLFPEPLVALIAWTTIALELFVAGALIMNTRTGALAGAALLAAYALAMGINILRGRRDIDCGCAGPAIRQTLSGRLVIRNLVFMAMALSTCIPGSGSRALGFLDWFTTVFATVVFGLIYTTVNQLSSVSGRFVRPTHQS